MEYENDQMAAEAHQAMLDEQEQLILVLRKCFPILDDDDISLLCYECGINKEDV